ncbi:MAG: tRNA (adenosine(37)-N6)-dimethylallyltransferase MiaA [Nitrospirae bacterium]|nr:tRNA (adenosine(37)-N6)-dimethylallyltransferase MiaA [Nitrospirota bacterium]
MNKVIILLGPTAVGKTGVSILLAKALNTEIISADSMQIYRHMDIGTAKPSPEERTMIKHHMIDIVEPWESFSTGKYISMVVPIIESIHRNGKIPIIVGGTGLYIKAMTRGIFSGPSADWTLRENLLSLEKEEEGSLYKYLKELDPMAAVKITPKDTRRIIRALEVCIQSNTGISDMQEKFTKPLPYDFIKIGITRDRKELYSLIENRVDNMFKAGLIEEVKTVTKLIENAMSENVSQFPSMQAIGYKEIAMYLHGNITHAEAVRIIKKGTKRYAKRQFTWFKKEEAIHWADITGIYDNYKAYLIVYGLLKKYLDHLQKS